MPNTNQTTLADNTPILVGAGQSVYRGSFSDFSLEGVESSGVPPVDLAVQAAQRAVTDSGAEDALLKAIDTVICTRLFADSSPFLGHAFGACENFTASVANGLQARPKELIYVDVGGQSPQRVLNEMAESIFDGERESVVLAGSEALGLIKQASKVEEQPDWSAPMPSTLADAKFEDRGMGKPFGGNLELNNGIALPTGAYALFENAWRAKQGLSVKEHQLLMSELFSRFTKVAANNPYAQFPEELSVDFLSESSPKNFDIASPYLKWHVAQDAVNQGAAVVLTSVGKARALGISEDKWVYLHGYGDADDALITERESLSSTPAVTMAANTALEMSGCSISDIARFEIYSCFPCAVIFACESMGIDWKNKDQELTLTGGLPFFGGPGNNYSMHGIAEMVASLRDGKKQFGLVFANGGYLSKASIGVYSATPPQDWQPSRIGLQLTESAKNQLPEKPLEGTVSATLESYSISFNRGKPGFTFVVATDENGKRIAAKVAEDDTAFIAKLLEGEAIGTAVTISPAEKGNYCVQA